MELKKIPKGPIFEGKENADYTLVGWGSTLQVMREVRLALEKEGKSVNHVHFRTMWPIHAEETKTLLEKQKKTICIENNFTSQMAKLVRMETGFTMDTFINKYDGEPFSFEYLKAEVEAAIDGKKKAKKEKELVGA